MKKRYFALLLAALLMLSLCACKSKEAKAVDSQIEAIGEVTLESKQAIEAAEAAVKALTEEQRGELDQQPVLDQARKTYEQLLVEKANQEKIDAVEATIDAIGEVTLESQEAIDTARADFDALSAELQGRVENAAALEAAETALFDAKVAEVDEAIDAIGEVTLKSGPAIKRAVRAYADAEEDVQAACKAQVLGDAQDTFTQLRADDAQAAIDAIGEVTLESKEAIDAAREKYDDLSDKEAALVDDSALKAAESTYASLLKAHKAQQKQEMMKNFKTEHDDFRNITWYQHKSTPQYSNTETYVLPYIAERGEDRTLYLRMNYAGRNWVFFETVYFLLDDLPVTRTFNYYDVHRDSAGGMVGEYVDLDCNFNDIKLIESMILAKETKVRFEGDDSYSDITITAEDKQHMQEVLDLWYLLEG